MADLQQMAQAAAQRAGAKPLPGQAGYVSPSGAGAALKTWLFGGNATKGMASGPQTADYQRNYLQELLGRGAPTMNTGQADQSRGQQNALSSMLFRTAAGQGPSAGEMAVGRQVDNAMAAQTAQAQMARGAGAALAGRTAARNNVDIAVNGAGAASQARAADAQMAQNQLANLLGTQRGQDIQTAGANQQAQLSQEGLQISALAQMLGVDEATLRQDIAKRQIAAGDKGMLPSLLQIGGQIGAAAATGGV